MELQKINQRIAVVNGESKRLNNERQMLIGKRQTLEKQLSDLLAEYEKSYGVKLTAETIEAEIARVAALKDAEVSNIEMMLSLVKSGDYAGAERLASGQEAVASAETPQQDAPVAEETQKEPAPVAPPVFERPPESAPGPVAPPVFERPPDTPPAPPATPPAPTAAPPAPPTFAPPVTEDAPPAPPPTFSRPAPSKAAVPGAPKVGVPPAVGPADGGKLSFQAILSGQAFNPQNGG